MDSRYGDERPEFCKDAEPPDSAESGSFGVGAVAQIVVAILACPVIVGAWRFVWSTPLGNAPSAYWWICFTQILHAPVLYALMHRWEAARAKRGVAFVSILALTAQPFVFVAGFGVLWSS